MAAAMTLLIYVVFDQLLAIPWAADGAGRLDAVAEGLRANDMSGATGLFRVMRGL